MNSAIGSRDAAIPKLPLWDTICYAYSAYFYYFLNVLRMSWLWLVVVVPLTALSNWLQWSWMAALLANAKTGQGGQGGMSPQVLAMASRPIGTMVVGFAAGLTLALAAVSIAVAWHRLLILGEEPGPSGSNIATGNVWRYVGIGIAICVISFLPALLIAVPILILSASVGSGFALLIPVVIVLYLTGAAAMLRLSLLLPARAVGDLGLGFGDAWRRTRGNTWRLFWGILACTLPPMLAAQVVSLLLVGFPGPGMFGTAMAARMTVFSLVFTVYYLLIVPITIGFLSLSYRHFFRRG